MQNCPRMSPRPTKSKMPQLVRSVPKLCSEYDTLGSPSRHCSDSGSPNKLALDRAVRYCTVLPAVCVPYTPAL